MPLKHSHFFVSCLLACSVLVAQELYTVDGIALDSSELERLTMQQKLKAEQAEQTQRFVAQMQGWIKETAPAVIANSTLSEGQKQQLAARMQVMQADLQLLGQMTLEQLQGVEISARVVKMQSLDHNVEALQAQIDRANERLGMAEEADKQKVEEEIATLQTQLTDASTSAENFRTTHKLPKKADKPE
jgi:hypothetical protein